MKILNDFKILPSCHSKAEIKSSILTYRRTDGRTDGRTLMWKSWLDLQTTSPNTLHVPRFWHVEVGARRVSEHDNPELPSSVAKFLFVGLVFSIGFSMDSITIGISIGVAFSRPTSGVSLGIIVVTIATSPGGS